MGDICKQSSSQCLSESADRISNLPKDLLHHVLSFLPTLDVVRTCVLAKRWRNIWCSVPTLSFVQDLKLGFVKFVDSVLLLRDGSNIQHLSLNVLNAHGRKNVWIIYALRHNVEALDLKLNRATLTPCIFISDTLKEIKLTFNTLRVLRLPDSICLPSLRILHFESVDICGRIDEAFFLGMPSLKTFILERCRLWKSITISACRLETLKIHSCRTFVCPETIIIFPGMLKDVELKIPNEPVTLTFNGKFSYLSDAKFDIALKSSEGISTLIGKVKHAESLTLSSQFFLSFVLELQKDISKMNRMLPQFPNLKRLTIESLFGDGEVLFINNLLKHSPQIESVFLLNKMGKNSFDTTQCELYVEEQLWSKQKFLHLKLVEIKGFQGSDSEVKMAQFLLENAICLKRLTITIAKLDDRKSVNNEEMMKIQRRLSRHPRASSSAGIDFLQTL